MPPVNDVTPAFVRVTEEPNATAPPPDIPVPAVTVTEELVNWLFAIEPKVPPRVKFPEVVTVPVNVMPFTVPVPPTEVTVPVFPVNATPFAESTPVEGTKLNFVEEVFCGKLPVVVVTQVG